MHLSRLMVFSLMVTALVVPAVAQSSPSDRLGAVAPLFGAPAVQTDWRTRIPALSAKPRVLNGLGEAQAVGSMSLGGLTLGSPAFGLSLRNFGPAAGWMRSGETHGCYTVRTYRFERDGPQADSTRLTEYYACALVARFQAKNIVGSWMIPAF
jgi:hypothetical protein